MSKDFGQAGAKGKVVTSATGVEQFMGTPPARPAVQRARLKLRATPNFLLVHYPTRWMCVPSTGEWLPQLAALRLEPGINGVDKNLDDSLARARIARKGGVIIPESTAPQGYASYVQAIDCEGGVYHCTIWQTPRQIGDRVLPEIVDTEGYYTWLRSLVANGVVPPPEPIVLETLVDQQKRKLESLAKDVHIDGVSDRVAAEKAYIAKMEAGEIGGIDADAPPAPDTRDAEIAELKAALEALKAQQAAQAQAPEADKPKRPRKADAAGESA